MINWTFPRQFEASTVYLALALLFAAFPARGASDQVVYKTIYTFRDSRDGADPKAGLIDTGGVLYGTSDVGGTFNRGTVFSLAPTGSEKVLYSFRGGSDGANPRAGLIKLGQDIYGTTAGEYGEGGTVFRITPTGAVTVVYSFEGGIDGAEPTAGLVDVDGILYGTTSLGGIHSFGTVFSVNPKTGVHKVLYSFKGNAKGDGADPEAGLTNLDGTLFGTTFKGGKNHTLYHGWGTVFSITPAGEYTLKYLFRNGSDGASPDSILTNVDGQLYGATENGGTPPRGSVGCGTIFRITATGVETVVYTFEGEISGDGCRPSAERLLNIHGTLYGTTVWGGHLTNLSCISVGCGTVFSVTPSGSETVLYSFKAMGDGAAPNSGLINIGNTLFGATPIVDEGVAVHPDIIYPPCPLGCGTIFAVTP
jgi:uncharacterized repeat protein (TIGR03803 family)